ncbi:hypothetical protein L7F22_042204 [Adiantum nelumboides]|nr:hypothetical protein [Adiantum nelumboides]
MQDSCSGIHSPSEEKRLRQTDTRAEREPLPRVHVPVSNLAHTIPRQTSTTNVTDRIDRSPQHSLRSLLVDRNGRTQYFGPTAHSSYLTSNIRARENDKGSAYTSADELTEEIDDTQAEIEEFDNTRRGNSVDYDGIGQTTKSSKQEMLNALLPTEDSLKDILDRFQEQVCWMYSPIVNLNVETLQLHEGLDSFEKDERTALCFAIMSNVQASEGASENLSRPSQFHQQILQKTYKLCWSVLNSRQWTACNSLTIQQTFFLLCIFLLNFRGGQMSDHFSSVFGICIAKAIESGLNTESNPSANTDSIIQKERQRLFWELYSLDAFRSLAYGRPCFFQDAAITLNIPDGEDDFHIIKYANSRIINRIMASHLNKSSDDFEKTMEFDSQIRDLFARLPSRLRIQNIHRIGNSLRQSPTEILQSCTLALNIHQTLLHLYRPWFVSSTLARIQGKENSYTAQHERSALCLAESSQAMIDACSRVYSSHPQIMMNWAFFLHHTFNAGVCRAIQAIYGHSTDPLHYTAKDDVDESIELLGRAKAHNRESVWTEKARLLKKLRQTYVRCQGDITKPTKKQMPKASTALKLLGATLHSHDDEVEGESSRDTFIFDNVNYQPLSTNYSDTTLTVFQDNQHTSLIGNTIADTNDASSWLDLLNNDAFTLTMADLWNTKDVPWMDTSSYEQQNS